MERKIEWRGNVSPLLYASATLLWNVRHFSLSIVKNPKISKCRTGLNLNRCQNVKKARQSLLGLSQVSSVSVDTTAIRLTLCFELLIGIEILKLRLKYVKATFPK